MVGLYEPHDLGQTSLSKREMEDTVRQKEDDIRRLKAQLERYRGLKSASQTSQLTEENYNLQNQISKMEKEKMDDRAMMERMAQRIEELERMPPHVMNGHHPQTNSEPPVDPMLLDKLHMRIEALEEELEREKYGSSLLQQDKQSLKQALSEMQQREKSQIQSQKNDVKDKDGAGRVVDYRLEADQLRAALDAAERERRQLQQDREKERKMFMDNNAKGEDTRMELMELRKNFYDMQAAVQQLEHELKLRNETIADLQQQIIFYQQMDKKKAQGGARGAGSRHGARDATDASDSNDRTSGGESPVYECSRCHQYFKDMSQFQGHITRCLEFRLFHSNRRSKSLDPLHQAAVSSDRISPFPISNSQLSVDSRADSQSTILTKYSYDNLRAAGLTNTSSQLKITAVDSRHFSPHGDRDRMHSVGAGSKRGGPVQKGIQHAYMYDPDRSKAMSTPHLPSHEKRTSMEGSNSMGGFESDYSQSSGYNLNESTDPETEPVLHTVAASNAKDQTNVPSKPSQPQPMLHRNADEMIKPELSASVQSANPSFAMETRGKPLMGNPTLNQRPNGPGIRVESAKTHQSQPAPQFLRLGPGGVKEQSPSFSSSSSDGVREATLDLRAEASVHKKRPDSFALSPENSRRDANVERVRSPLGLNAHFRGPDVNPASPQPFIKPQVSPNSKAAQDARQKLIDASMPGESLMQKLDSRSSPVKGPEPRMQTNERPGFVPIGHGYRNSSEMLSPREEGGIDIRARQNQNERVPLSNQPGRRSEPPINQNGLPDNRNEHRMSWRGGTSTRNSSEPVSPGGSLPRPPNNDDQFRNGGGDSASKQFEKKSISFNKEQITKKMNTAYSNKPNVHVPAEHRKTGVPSPILKNAPKGLQVVDNLDTTDDMVALNEPGNNAAPKRASLNARVSMMNGNDSDSSSSKQNDKENIRRNSRSKSPSLKNFRNRFFSGAGDGGKKEKAEKEKEKDKKRDKQEDGRKTNSLPRPNKQDPRVMSPPPNAEMVEHHERGGVQMGVSATRGRAQHPTPMRAFDRPRMQGDDMGREHDSMRGHVQHAPPPHAQAPRTQFSAEMRVGLLTEGGPAAQYRRSRPQSQPPGERRSAVAPQSSAVSTDV